MRAAEFNDLPLVKKGKVWRKNGVYLDERILHEKCRIEIYSLFNFYVEVYHNLRDNQIGTIKALEDSEDFDRLLKNVQLELLY